MTLKTYEFLDFCIPFQKKDLLSPAVEGCISTCITRVLQQTKHTMLTQSRIEKSTNPADEAQRHLTMFRLCVLVLPRIHIWNVEPNEYEQMKKSDLVYLLAQSSISQHKLIASSAQHVMTYLMMYHVELRCCLIEDTSVYLLQQRGIKVKNIQTLLKMINAFMTIWIAHIKDSHRDCNQVKSNVNIIVNCSILNFI